MRAKLDRIMASGYYTAQLEMRPPLDLAAAVASFGAGGVQVQESMVVSPQAPEAVEENLAVEGHKVKSYLLFCFRPFVNVWLAFPNDCCSINFVLLWMYTLLYNYL